MTSPTPWNHPYGGITTSPTTQAASVATQQMPRFEPPLQQTIDMVNDQDAVNIKDFTLKRKRILFKLDDDVFEARSKISLALMQDMMRVGKSMESIEKDGKFERIVEVFNNLLVPASAERFAQRVTTNNDAEAVDAREELIPILFWLLEQYGLRPTQPSSDSSTGSPSESDGTTSTVGQ